MATVKTSKKDVTDEIAWCKRTLEDIPWDKLSLHYDQEADVLYIHLKPYGGMADTKRLDKDGILLEYAGKELVGIIIFDASQR